MSGHYIYRLYDPKSGELLHEGTPTELVAAGLFPNRDRLQSEYMRQKKTVKRPRLWRIEREKLPPAGTRTQLREVWVYTIRDAEGGKVAEGTAAELVEQGYFGTIQDAANWVRKGGCPKRGIAKLTREKARRGVRQRNTPRAHAETTVRQRPEPKKKAAASRIPGIKEPDALQLDVHALCGYNKAARKQGLPELSYGVWAVRDKPEKP